MVTLNYYSFDKILGSQYGTYTKLNNYYREVIDYCFEFYDDDTSDIVPHYHGNRLMKDEYIDGLCY